MDFTACLLEQLRLHPSTQPRDVIKMCYQAARGAEHLLSDLTRARTYFDQEYAATPADVSLPLFEPLSENVARVNIAPWKAAGFPAEWLFRMFVYTATVPQDGADLLGEYIAKADALVGSMPGWQDALAAWTKQGRPAVHHSEEYRAAEHPAYRIVNARFQCLLPVLKRLLEHPAQVIAMDGRAASGKTTRAALLSAVLAAPVIHMDDFFLPPALRTPERLAQPGGNVDYERFAQEVVPHLLSGEGFSYRVFDCSVMDIDGLREIPAAPVRIVEGSYAHHPALGNYADLRIFTTVDEVEQQSRILRRNGERMLEMFRTRWIPMEEKYFSHFSIREKAELVL
ncbi:MAG: hypothetical protein IJA83_12615 [Clostridia bacterium]|nr:hypothetical protein [Clostridia bacterium]